MPYPPSPNQPNGKILANPTGRKIVGNPPAKATATPSTADTVVSGKPKASHLKSWVSYPTA